MKKLIFLLFIEMFAMQFMYPRITNNMNQPDSVYLFVYAAKANHNHDGLQFAWSVDRINWHAVGQNCSFLNCDYGRWGTEKRMLKLYLLPGSDGFWHSLWSVNEQDNVIAHAESADLIHWGRQSYTHYAIPDFKIFSAPYASSIPLDVYTRVSLNISGEEEDGTVHRVPWSLVDNLIRESQLRKYHSIQDQECTRTDSVRFGSMKNLQASVSADLSKNKSISDMLIGVFFEDINYAADGGLYAELIQNRDFEYALGDKEGKDPKWNGRYAWSVSGDGLSFKIDTVAPINLKNPHYAVLDVSKEGTSFVNSGFDGIAVKAAETYNVSLFARNVGKTAIGVKISIVDAAGICLAETKMNISSRKWKKYKTTLLSTKTVNGARLFITPLSVGRVDLDMISLFPQHTFKNHSNGLRADLAQTIADIHPRFVRFPGGCVTHGDGLNNIYRWKNTIGPLESRTPQRNLWGYHQSVGLGYFEYFQFCEDINAEPVPVIAAGVPCQNSATGGAGQQGGIPMTEMKSYTQDILDLIEYANGDPSTKWGRIRSKSGHPQPFHLKYIGIGNEDLISDVFEERYTYIIKVLKEKHPEITVIGTVGPTFEGTDYEEGWRLATKLNVPIVDEHYYQSPGWFINHRDFYDKYDRSKSKVYLGEYAAHLPGRPNNLETALAEALYLTDIERNADVVKMTSYAPLLANKKHTQWNPDLIYFTNDKVMLTSDYYVQKLYGENSGDEYIPSEMELSNEQEFVKHRIGISIVKDTRSGDVIVKLVNLLPLEVNMNLKLKGIDPILSVSERTVLSASSPAAKDVVIHKEKVNVAEAFSLSPYSFSILRIKAR